jgi:Zn finger protein HypA/HybF involved in hydrogenase expression
MELNINQDLLERSRKLTDFVFSSRNKLNDFVLSSYIIDNKVMDYECRSCKQDSIWNGKLLTLILDRVNNKITDNTLENLRFLCPNCYSQFRKKMPLLYKQTQVAQRQCIDCNKTIKNKRLTSSQMKNYATNFRCKRCLEKQVTNSSSVKII